MQRQLPTTRSVGNRNPTKHAGRCVIDSSAGTLCVCVWLQIIYTNSYHLSLLKSTRRRGGEKNNADVSEDHSRGDNESARVLFIVRVMSELECSACHHVTK